MTGVVIRVLLNKGYCFVRGNDRVSRMLHVNDFIDAKEFDTIHEGSGVEFEPVNDGNRGNGARAIKAKRID
jgi:cold shock CspA family protein